ncbi:hypothetical protein BUALT_Bualt10G0103700 [Buddleja alternifolia]|uniref:Cytochrome P450 n=1 Tax=Buddleja alternifolia TaxID=168488 RepID=A0AAV6X8F6_9LAMI|nr:hypothetical protein BUALT_Bualt10G0103700 [Buddleja alternifolia]
MEIQLPFNFISLLLFISLIFSLIKLWKKSKNPKTNKNLPPSPPALPLIGHLHHLLGGALPHVSIRKLSQKYGPIMYLQLGEVPAVIISSPQLAKHALKLHDPSCADRPQSIVSEIMYYHSTDIAFSPYGAYWKQMREICIFEMLSPKNVRSFGSIRIDEASRLIESIRGCSG